MLNGVTARTWLVRVVCSVALCLTTARTLQVVWLDVTHHLSVYGDRSSDEDDERVTHLS